MRKKTPSRQDWKLKVPVDLFDEYNPSEDDTQQVFIDDPEEYMEDLELEDEITEVYRL